MVWHDREVSYLRYASFDRFVAAQYLTVFADLDSLDDDGGDPVAFLREDVARVTDLLDPGLQAMLHGCLESSPGEHPYGTGRSRGSRWCCRSSARMRKRPCTPE